MLGHNEASTDQSATAAGVAQRSGTDPLAQCKADLEQFVADVRDKLHQMRQMLEHRSPPQATAATAMLPPPTAASTAAERHGRRARGSAVDSIAPPHDPKVTAAETVATAPIAALGSDALQTEEPSSLLGDPQDPLQSLKVRLTKQLQQTAAAGHPLISPDIR